MYQTLRCSYIDKDACLISTSFLYAISMVGHLLALLDKESKVGDIRVEVIARAIPTAIRGGGREEKINRYLQKPHHLISGHG